MDNVTVFDGTTGKFVIKGQRNSPKVAATIAAGGIAVAGLSWRKPDWPMYNLATNSVEPDLVRKQEYLDKRQNKQDRITEAAQAKVDLAVIVNDPTYNWANANNVKDVVKLIALIVTTEEII